MPDLIETADVVGNRRLRERAAEGAAARLPVGRVHSRDEHTDAGRAGAGALGLPETVTAGSRRYLEAARDAGLRRVVVSSSANTAEVLEATGLAALVEGWIDGLAIAAQGLKGKPAPDTFLAGARCAGVEPARAAVFEDALAGVEAGRTGGFGFAVGVDRTEHADALRAHGADIVVGDLAQLLGGANGEATR